MEIRAMLPSDWDRVRAIYMEGIETGMATFETEAPDFNSWDKSHFQNCRLVIHEKGQIMGWTALSPVSDRCVYGGVGEVSIYISSKARNKGFGTKLLRSLVQCSEKHGLWTLQAEIFSENSSSILIHEKAGFRIIGLREKIGKFNGVWKDNILMERRSQTVGQE